MKLFKHAFSALWLSFIVSHPIVAGEENQTKDLPVIQSLFVPSGFDGNDEVTVVVEGYLPNPCHRLSQPDVRVDRLTGRIAVGARSHQLKKSCPDIAVPFVQEVRIGKLAKGPYSVVTLDGRLEQNLEIGLGNGGVPDDHLYAPVDHAWVEYPERSNWIAILEGRFTNTCMRIEDAEVKVTLTGRTIQVQPILRYKANGCGTPCKVTDKPFRKTVQLPNLREEGRYLLHVRSLNGEAVNEVFSRTPEHL